MPEPIGIIIAFVYGAIVGSFLNVCIYRMPHDLSVAKPGSHCPHCQTPLRAWDLVPLLSQVALRAKCRYCKAPISWRYFGIEFLTALCFASLYWLYVLQEGSWLNFISYALFSAALVAIFFIDLEHYIIPDQLNLFGLGVGVAADIAGLALKEHSFAHLPVPGLEAQIPIPRSLIGLVICGGIFYLIAEAGTRIFKKEAMGGGDIKLAAAIGAVLPLGMALLSFFIAVTVGSVLGVGLMALRRKQADSQLPFGPMMVLGVFIVFYFGQGIIDWYLTVTGLA
ncbi:MAG: prepilin peptidase [Armatimonadetes bacterium]|nr:prepilin peptidase [Armatimonadota bacterium]